MIVAVLGLGEAGGAIAADLVEAGLAVQAWDPDPSVMPAGVRLAKNDHEAIAGSDLILSVNLASVALEAARSALPVLDDRQVFADLNTASPGLKRAIDAAIAPSGALFADVALLGPVPGRGLKTPALASGPGARRFAQLLAPYGMPVTVLDDRTGSAAGHKLVRSIFMKGLAMAVIESLEAARLLDCEAWQRAQILAVLGDEQLLNRLVAGSLTHAARRQAEMEAAAQLLNEVEIESFVTKAAIQWFEHLRGR